MARSLVRFHNDDTGTAALEAAIVIPALMVLGLGAVEFSNAFYDHQLISMGVRDAARYLARVPQPDDTAAQANAKDIAVYGGVGDSKPRVAGWSTGDVTVSSTAIDNTDGTYRGSATIYIVTVSTTLTYPQIGLLKGLGLTPPAFTITHSERAIGD